jgi:hypothetical protein
MKQQNKGTDKRKTTSERPVSLDPLDFEQALRGLLEVAPPPKDADDSEPKKPVRKKKKPGSE